MIEKQRGIVMQIDTCGSRGWRGRDDELIGWMNPAWRTALTIVLVLC
jgi:hypothetical protein